MGVVGRVLEEGAEEQEEEDCREGDGCHPDCPACACRHILSVCLLLLLLRCNVLGVINVSFKRWLLCGKKDSFIRGCCC